MTVILLQRFCIAEVTLFVWLFPTLSKVEFATAMDSAVGSYQARLVMSYMTYTVVHHLSEEKTALSLLHTSRFYSGPIVLAVFTVGSFPISSPLLMYQDIPP